MPLTVPKAMELFGGTEIRQEAAPRAGNHHLNDATPPMLKLARRTERNRECHLSVVQLHFVMGFQADRLRLCRLHPQILDFAEHHVRPPAGQEPVLVYAAQNIGRS
jgi:hypothetical protein